MVVGDKIYGYDDYKYKMPANGPKGITNVDFHDSEFMSMLGKTRVSKSSNQELFDILLSFSICHDVIIEKGEENRDRSIPKYNASSPDELAFINMARFCGWEYVGIDANNIISVKYGNDYLRYRLLHTIEFNSDRKRMSVIVEELSADVVDGEGKVNMELLESDSNRIFVYTKGADNMIYERLKNREDMGNVRLKNMKEQLEGWSVNGLRTLVFAKREIKKEYYMKWSKMYAFSLSKLDKL